jgi:hypothetical protein
VILNWWYVGKKWYNIIFTSETSITGSKKKVHGPNLVYCEFKVKFMILKLKHLLSVLSETSEGFIHGLGEESLI